MFNIASMSMSGILFKEDLHKTNTSQVGGKDKKNLYVLLALEECMLPTTFGLWTSMGAHNTFALVVNFIYAYW
jgi:hypothetical protein